MAAPSGVAGQFGYVKETTVGTAVTVDTFLPVNSAAIKNDISRLDSQGIRAGRAVTWAWKPGQQAVTGTVEMELWNADIAQLFKQMFGTVSTATNGSQWDYTYTPVAGSLTGKSMTVQIGDPDSGGTVRPFTYAGCKVGQWTISSEVDQIATLSLDIVGMTETNGVAVASASYDSALEPFVFSEASLTIGGSAVNTVKSLEIVGDNNLSNRFRLGSATSREYLENGMRNYTGTVTTDFESLTAYDRFVNGTEAALVATFDNGTESLVFTMNVRFDGETPELSGMEMLEQSLPFKCVSATNDASAITAVLTNADGLTAAD